MLRRVAARPPMSPRRCWLVKSEPDAFSFDDLLAVPDRTTAWEGVRNHQARNFMRDGMRLGDPVLFYHSNAAPPGVAGVCRVVREAYPDPTAFDPRAPSYDPKSRREAPTWLMVDVQAVAPLPRYVALDALRANPALEGLELLRRGSRLSVMPVTPTHFDLICRMGALGRGALR